MNKKHLAAATVIAINILAVPAVAEVRTYSGDDQHLYLNESKDKFPSYEMFSGWSVSGTITSNMPQGVNPVVRGVSALDGDFFVSRGPFKISNERFFDLLTQAKVAPEFVAKYRGKRDAPNVLWPALISLGLTGIGGVGTYLGAATFQNPLGMWTGVGLLTAGGLGALYTSYIYLTQPSGPSIPAPEEAYEAIKVYNKKLDGQAP